MDVNTAQIANVINPIIGWVLLILIILVLGAGIVGFWWWWRYKKIDYNTDLDVWVRRDDGKGGFTYDKYQDIGGEQTTRKGMIVKFHLKNLNKWTKPPTLEAMKTIGGRRKGSFVLIEDTLFPVVETMIQGEKDTNFVRQLNLVDKDMSFFTINMLDELERLLKNPTWLEKYGATMIIAIGVMLNMIFIYVLTNNLISIAGTFKGAMDTLNQITSKQNDLIQNISAMQNAPRVVVTQATG